MAEDVQKTTPAPVAAPVYMDQPPEEPKSTTSYLILTVNIILLALAVFWVVFNSKKNADTKPAAIDVAGTTTLNPGDGPKPEDPFQRFPAPGPLGANPGGALGQLDERRAAAAAAAQTSMSPNRKTVRDAPTLSSEDRARTASVLGAIEGMGPGLDLFRSMNKAYPSSRGAATDSNRGNEALTEFLSKKNRLAETGFQTADTDGDGRAELLDAWGNPFIYFSGDDYAAPQTVTQLGTASGKGGTIYAQQRAGNQDGGAQSPIGAGSPAFDNGAWQAAERFQLWSAGPNGIDDGGSYDDIASWSLR